MSTYEHNENDSIFADRDRISTERMIEQTDLILANTKAFLDSLDDEDHVTREYVEAFKLALEADLRRLAKKLLDDPDPGIVPG